MIYQNKLCLSIRKEIISWYLFFKWNSVIISVAIFGAVSSKILKLNFIFFSCLSKNKKLKNFFYIYYLFL